MLERSGTSLPGKPAAIPKIQEKTSAFAGTNPNDFVYMYVNFGSADMTTAGGFEEFTLVRNLAPVPEMSAFFPIVGLLVAVGSTSILRRRRAAQVKS